MGERWSRTFTDAEHDFDHLPGYRVASALHDGGEPEDEYARLVSVHAPDSDAADLTLSIPAYRRSLSRP